MYVTLRAHKKAWIKVRSNLNTKKLIVAKKTLKIWTPGHFGSLNLDFFDVAVINTEIFVECSPLTL